MPEATVFPGAAPLQPEASVWPAPAPVVSFTVLPDLAVKAVLPRGADLNETAASQLYSRLGELAGDRRVAVVLELTGVKSGPARRGPPTPPYRRCPPGQSWANPPWTGCWGHFLLGGEFSSVPARHLHGRDRRPGLVEPP